MYLDRFRINGRMEMRSKERRSMFCDILQRCMANSTNRSQSLAIPIEIKSDENKTLWRSKLRGTIDPM